MRVTKASVAAVRRVRADACCRGSTRSGSRRTAWSSSTSARSARTSRSTTAGCARAARCRPRSRRTDAPEAPALGAASRRRERRRVAAGRAGAGPAPALRLAKRRSSRRPTSSTRASSRARSRASRGARRAARLDRPALRREQRARAHVRLGDHLVPVPRAARGGPADPPRRPRGRHLRDRGCVHGAGTRSSTRDGRVVPNVAAVVGRRAGEREPSGPYDRAMATTVTRVQELHRRRVGGRRRPARPSSRRAPPTAS